MILNVVIGPDRRYAETWPEMSSLIAEVMDNLKGERTDVIDGISYELAGDVARFACSDQRHDSATRLPDGSNWPSNELVVAVNRVTGYGALVWFVNRRYARTGGIHDRIWVSDNPQPPGFDTRVVSDPWASEFHDPRSTLRLPQIRAALEEFCRTGTGDRPQSVTWVEAADFNGKRGATG
jgi:hypothetical protein